MSGAASEWDERQLCPDGGCVGVIGADGACPICGRVGLAPVRRAAAPGEEAADLAAAQGDSAFNNRFDKDITSREAERGEDASARGDDWDDRQLCVDGGCIGVIEAGRCNVCGKPPIAP